MELSIVEQRYRAVLDVNAGRSVTEVAAEVEAQISEPVAADATPTGGAAPTDGQYAVIELDRIVPPSGNLGVAGQQFWLGPQRAGARVRLWMDIRPAWRGRRPGAG